MTEIPWVAVIVALFAAASSWAVVRSTNRKLDSEGTSLLTGAALSLISPLEDRIDGLEARVRYLEFEAEHWQVVAAKGAAAYENETGNAAEWYVPFENDS